MHSPKQLPILIAACVSGFLFQFDLTALSAALPDVAASLSAKVSDQAWIIDIYSLSLIFALPLAGPIIDRWGKRRMFFLGAFLFAASSAFCAISGTLTALLMWRSLQGISGALLTVSASALVASVYTGEERIRAFGVLGTVVGLSMVLGPPLGALMAASLGWPWVFWINIPVCIALMLLLRRAKDESAALISGASKTRLDVLGPASLAISIGSLAWLLMAESSTNPIGFVVACALAFAVFVFVEKRHPAPAFDFALFASKRFIAMCLVPVAGSIGFWALLVHLPQMARGVMGLSQGATGLLLTALTVPMLPLPSLGARLAAKLPQGLFFAGGLSVIALGDLLLALASMQLSHSWALWAVVASLFVSGCGCALINSQITAAAVSAVPQDRAATASAICVTMRQIGFAFGIALIGAFIHDAKPASYSISFAIVSLITFVLASISFILLRHEH